MQGLERLPHTSGVYLIVCLPTGKTYIGSSKRIRKRLNEHLHYLRRKTHANPYLQHAWDKHGEQSFECRVLDECPEDVRIEWEQQYLDLYRSYDHAVGFNINPTARDLTGQRWTNEQRAAQSRRLTGKRASNESRQKRREAWAIHGDEWRRIARETRGLAYDLVSPTGERVMGKGVTELARQIGVHHADLCRLVKGVCRSVKGWRRTDDPGDPPYIMLDPRGREVSIPRREWASFCRQHGLVPSRLHEARTGKQTHHQGWTRPENRSHYVTVEHVDGRRVTLLPYGRKTVCDEERIDSDAIGSVLSGHTQIAYGWTLSENATFYREFFRFYDGDGTLVTVPWGMLKDWVDARELDYYPVLNVARGSRESYNGYHRFYPSLDAFKAATEGRG